ncbi:MMPL family transporter [Ornithinimicrobium sufpigmenti]|uniref:MMPL family transporter n=1 Tax=Ornithinimicrobium sufpigmenti TaxID=2508882 RepID=UPI001035D768|nr:MULTISPECIES: MMPL family transporter [unclassified Ornithinimicrobium]
MSRIIEAITGRRSWIVAVVGVLLGLLVIVGVGPAERSASPLDTLPAGFESTQGQELLEGLPDEGNQAAIVLFTVEDEGIADLVPDLASVVEDVAPDGAEPPETNGGMGGEMGMETGEQSGPPEGAGEGEGQGGPPEGAEEGEGQGGPPPGVEDGEGEGQGGPPEGAEEGEGQGGPPPGVADAAFPVIPAEDGTAAFSVLEINAPTSSDARDAIAELRSGLTDAVPDGVTAQVTGPAAISADLASVFDGANFTLLAATASVVAILLIVTYRSPILWILPLAVVGIADQVATTAATHVLKAVGVPWDESTVGILSVLVFGAGTNYALLLISRYRDELRQHESRHKAMAIALRRAAEAIIASASTVAVGVLTLLLSVFPSTRGLGLASAVGILVAMLMVLVVLPAVLVNFGRWIFWPKVPRQGEEGLAEGRSVWRRIGDVVARRPVAWIVATLVVLAAMTAGLFQYETGLAPEDQFIDTPEAITAGQRLGESFPAGASEPIILVTETDDEATLAELSETVSEVSGVEQATVVPPEEGIGQLQVILDAEPGSGESQEAVLAIRDAVPDDVYVTGGDASALDEGDGNVQDRWLIMPLILVLIFLVLAGLLRSILAPLVLVLTTVATSAAALGVSWWLFTGVLGFSAIDASMPLLAFLFLVALGVDYNIFLITRTLEEAGEHGTRDGVLRALGATGGVITSAGILLAAVFAVLGVLPLVVLAQIGVVICIGVLLDTLVVRTVLTPAIVRVLGEHFWWPRRVDSAGRHREGDVAEDRELEPASG